MKKKDGMQPERLREDLQSLNFLELLYIFALVKTARERSLLRRMVSIFRDFALDNKSAVRIQRKAHWV